MSLAQQQILRYKKFAEMVNSHNSEFSDKKFRCLKRNSDSKAQQISIS